MPTPSATWTTPPDWSTSYVVLADDLDTYLSSDLLYLYKYGTQRGTTFPVSPSSGDLYYRTDRNYLYYYDGTRWLTTQEFSAQFTPLSSFVGSYSATQSDARWTGIRSDYTIYITRMETVTFSNATGANFFTFAYVASNGATVWSFTTASDTVNTAITHTTAAATQPGSVISYITLTMTKTGTITTFPNNPLLFYRLIG